MGPCVVAWLSGARIGLDPKSDAPSRICGETRSSSLSVVSSTQTSVRTPDSTQRHHLRQNELARLTKASTTQLRPSLCFIHPIHGQQDLIDPPTAQLVTSLEGAGSCITHMHGRGNLYPQSCQSRPRFFEPQRLGETNIKPYSSTLLATHQGTFVRQ